MRNGEVNLTITAERDFFVAWDYTDTDFKSLGIEAKVIDSELIKELNESNLKLKSQYFSGNSIK